MKLHANPVWILFSTCGNIMLRTFDSRRHLSSLSYRAFTYYSNANELHYLILTNFLNFISQTNMRLFSHICCVALILADLISFNRHRNSAHTHVTKRTENKTSLSASDTQRLSILMQLLKKGANQAALEQVNSILQKVNQNKATNARLSAFVKSH